MKVVLPSSCQHVNFGQNVVFCFAVFCFHRGLTFCQVLSSWLLAAHLPLEKKPWPQFLFWRHSRPPHLLLRPSATPFALFGRTIPLDVNCRISHHTFGQQLQNKYITSTEQLHNNLHFKYITTHFLPHMGARRSNNKDILNFLKKLPLTF